MRRTVRELKEMHARRDKLTGTIEQLKELGVDSASVRTDGILISDEDARGVIGALRALALGSGAGEVREIVKAAAKEDS